MTEIELESISKTYSGGVPALKDLSLRIRPGEVLAIVGPSGAGKTTLLRLIAGLEAPTGGMIRLGGRVVNAVPPHARNVAMVFQRHSLYPHLTVRENLEFALWMQRGGWWFDLLPRWAWKAFRSNGSGPSQVVAERVAEAAQILALDKLLDRRPAQLSGGEQQRVALGKALVRRPEIYLLDEPLSQLDTRLRAELRHYLHLLHRRLPATMIYVTHDQSEAMILGQRVGVLHEGCLQQVDTPQDVYDRPRSRFVAGFIGWPPMNFMDAVLRDQEKLLAGDCWELMLPRPQGRLLQQHGAASVTLGIRPEDVGIAETGQADCSPEMEVTVVERLGPDSALTFRRDSLRIVARVAGPSRVDVGEKRRLRLNMAKSHWFDRTTGMSLDNCGPAG